jgi:hypothetical protein
LPTAIAALPWRALDTTTLSAQLAHSRKRADRAALRCDRKPELKRQHQLRKRLRRHRMQITALSELLLPTAPVAVDAPAGFRAHVAAYAGTLDEIARRVDAIGARLDTALLRRAVRCLPSGHERKAALALLRRHASH